MQDGFERRVEQTESGEVVRRFLNANGVSYELDSIDPNVDFKLAKARLKLQIQDPCTAVAAELDRLPPKVRARAEKELWDRAFEKIQLPPEKRFITDQDIIQWLDDSEDGKDFSLLVMLYRKNPEFADLMAQGKVEEALKRAGEIRKVVTSAEFLKWRDEVNQQMVRQVKAEQAAA